MSEPAKLPVTRTPSEDVLRRLKEPYVLPNERAHEESPRDCSLLSDGPWDAIAYDRLFTLREIPEDAPPKGYVLRPYWMPALVLRYRSSSIAEMPDKTVFRTETQKRLTFLKCSTPVYAWREECETVLHLLDTWAPVGPDTRSVILYDQIQQTMQRTMPEGAGSLARDKGVDGRWAAIAGLPFLFPLGWVSVGQQWRGESGDDYMNYTLESEKTVDGMRLLLITKQGHLTLRALGPVRNNDECPTLRCFREGCIVFCPNRGVVLESRSHERILDGTGPEAKSLIGMDARMVERLIGC